MSNDLSHHDLKRGTLAQPKAGCLLKLLPSWTVGPYT